MFFRHKPKIINIPLSTLCVLWTDKQFQGDIGTGAESSITAPDIAMEAIFTLTEITTFYDTYIVPYSVPAEALKVIIELLRVLDEKGSCPSIVNDDPEAFKSLVSVTLLEHSLAVAGNAFAINNKGKCVIRNNTADVLIAALAHDIGKIPDLVKLDRGISNHVFTCLTFMKPLLVSLTTGPAIMEAIKFLHVKPKERQEKVKEITLLHILEEANAQARATELKTAQNALSQDKPKNTKESASVQDISDKNTEQTAAKQAEKQITKSFIIETLKPVLAQSIDESFIFADRIFICPAFLEHVISRAADRQNISADKLTKTLGCEEAAQTFIVRRYGPRSEPEPQPVMHSYISLNREMFGKLQKETFKKQKRLKIKKVKAALPCDSKQP
ncbi:MAG: HD domain-containing protein [Thermodesulfobacteriota bacterium]|nr:HD domain-containing protein [Thermodesulfobacteriota bacterium]